MQKRWICAFLILALCCSLVLPVSAEETAANTVKEKAVEIKNKTVTDSLPQKEAERWYTFTLENTADVIIRFTADFAEAGDYWQILVYRAREGKSDEYLESVGVGGGTMGQNDVKLPNHSAGTYYVKVMSRTKGSPGSPEKYFTPTPYKLEVITEGYTHPTGSAQRKTVSKAGEIIAVIGGKVYLKRNDGEAYVACYVSKDAGKEVSAPILLSENKEAVEYYTAKFTDRMGNFREMELDGKTYYYTYTRDGYQGIAKDDTLYQCFDGKVTTEDAAAGELLKLHFGVSPVEQAREKEARQGFWVWIIGAVLSLGGIVAAVVFVKIALSDKVYVDPEKFSGVSSHTPTEKELREMGEMQTIQRINAEINSPGYDPAGFSNSPGPDDPPSSDSVW